MIGLIAAGLLYAQDFTKPIGPEWSYAPLPWPTNIYSIAPVWFGYGEAIDCAPTWGCSGLVKADPVHGYANLMTRRKMSADNDVLEKRQPGITKTSIGRAGWVGTWLQLNRAVTVGQSAEAVFTASDDQSAAGAFWLYRQTSNKAIDPATGISFDAETAEIDIGECTGLGNLKVLCRFNLHYTGALPVGWTAPKGTDVTRNSKGWVSLQTYRTVNRGMHKYRVDRNADGTISMFLDDALVVTYPKIHELQGPLSPILFQTMGYKTPTTTKTIPRSLVVKSVTISQNP